MEWIDQKYINILSGSLQRFKRVGESFNFRCPYCGDSKKSKSKARGFLIERNNTVFYKCHNCGISKNFNQFCSDTNSELYHDYRKEKFLEHNNIVEKKDPITSFQKPKFIRDTCLADLDKVSQLDPEHPCKLYVVSRMIPTNCHYKLFYTANFKKWINQYVPGKFTNDSGVDERLVIPMIDRDQTLIGVQGRALDNTNKVRYITIIFNNERPKIFGLDSIDTSKTVFVLEGPIDSMFVSNSVANAGGDYKSSVDAIKQIDSNCDIVIVYDNDYRNKEIVGRIDKAIDEGYKVCLWPKNYQKDVNEIVLNGTPIPNIKVIIEGNTFKSLEAKLKLFELRL